MIHSCLVCVCVWLFQRFVPAWAGPELSASLLQLENFLKVSPEFQGGYLDGPIDFKSDPAMFPAEDSPELVPYRCLDASRLRLVGSGNWRVVDFIQGPLWYLDLEAPFTHKCPQSCFWRFCCRACW